MIDYVRSGTDVMVDCAESAAAGGDGVACHVPNVSRPVTEAELAEDLTTGPLTFACGASYATATTTLCGGFRVESLSDTWQGTPTAWLHPDETVKRLNATARFVETQTRYWIDYAEGLCARIAPNTSETSNLAGRRLVLPRSNAVKRKNSRLSASLSGFTEGGAAL